jgi:hypothetical protein
MKNSRLLLISAIVCFVFYDLISTILAFNYLGSFQYESSLLLRATFDIGGVPGFILIKAGISTLLLILVYLHVEYYPKAMGEETGMNSPAITAGLRGAGIGTLAGATIAGFFAGTSNLNIVLNGSSIWLMGIDSGTVAMALVIGSSVLGFLAVPAGKPIKTLKTVLSRIV